MFMVGGTRLNNVSFTLTGCQAPPFGPLNWSGMSLNLYRIYLPPLEYVYLTKASNVLANVLILFN